MGLRVIHASDLHLGKRFLSIPEPPDGSVRGRLREARHGAIGRLAQAARDHGAADIVLAGDTFDTGTPSPAILRQALAEMAAAAPLRWWLLPGNHDSARGAEALWDAILRDAPDNVVPLLDPAPRTLEGGAMLLPCPVARRASGLDPTASLDALATPEGALRVGLAHGGVTDFTGSGEAIAPDRDRRAGLDYLALGDWHGRMAVSERVHYSGSPEQDRFRHDARGVCLAVTLDGPGAVPKVDAIETGQFLWMTQALALQPGVDTATALAAALPGTGRRDTLMRVVASGWLGLAERAALDGAAAQVAPDFAHFALDAAALRAQVVPTDLDAIDRAGALRDAAEALTREADDPALAEGDRAVARDALARLYALVAGDAP